MKYDKVTVLSIIEAVRKNPGMYIGETDNPLHLFHEVIDNALDEATAGYASIIQVSYDDSDGTVTVMDNGRGIPIRWNEEEEEWDPIVIATKAHSGAKFDAEAYDIKIGLHGIGITAVNALSEYLEIATLRDDKSFYVKFDDSEPGKPIIGESPLQGTKITYKPNKEYFESVRIDKQRILARLRLATTFIPDLKVFYNSRQVEPLTDKDLCRDVDTPVWNIDVTTENGESMLLYFGYNTGTHRRDVQNGSVNLLRVDYGKHIEAMERAVRQAWSYAVDDKTRDYLESDDYLCGLRGFCLVKLRNPTYPSQTKEILGGPIKNFRSLIMDAAPIIADRIASNEVVFEALLRKFKDYRQHLNKLSSSKYLEEVIEVGSNNEYLQDRSIKPKSSFVDCISTSREGTELYVVEGDSAGGGIIPFRDPYKHAILPLRGKVLNVVNMDIKDILENIEIRSLINAIGVGCLHLTNVETVRYEKIIICTDADVDGSSIKALIIGALGYLMPEVIEGGYLYVAIAPLFGQYIDSVEIETDTNFHKLRSEDLVKVEGKGKRIKARRVSVNNVILEDGKEPETVEKVKSLGKSFYPVWDFNSRDENYELLRFKGLGSMDPDILSVSVLEPKTRQLQQVTMEDVKIVTDLVGQPTIRKRMLMDAGLVSPRR